MDRLFPRRRMRRAWNRRARSNAEYFVAGGHSESDNRFWESGQRDLKSNVLRDLVLDSSTQALEIGCGIGRLLRPLALRVDRAWGVDISEEMIAKARLALNGVENAEVLLTSGDLAPFGDATLDLVYSFIVFQHFPAKRLVSGYIREAARVLRSNGVFRFQVDGRPRWLFSSIDTWRGVWYRPNRLRRELAAHGFEVVDLWGEGTQYLWITALRRAEPGRTSSAAVRVQQRGWRLDALDSLLARLGTDAHELAEAVRGGETSLRELARPFLKRHRSEPASEFVRCAYEVILEREPDIEGLAFYSDEIARGVSRENTVDCLLASAELEDRVRPHVPMARN